MADKNNPFKGGKFTPYGVVSAIEGTPKNIWQALPKYLKEKGKTAVNTYETIDKIFKGEIDPESPEGMQAAMSAAMMVGTGGVGASGAVGGPGTMGMFIGRNAATFDKAAAEEALNMAKAGFNATDILKQTGTRRWKSGARQELDDSSAIFKKDYLDLPFANTRLKSMIDHPELFKAYPELENLKIIVRDDLPAKNAAMIFNRNEAHISREDVNSKDIEPLLHEIQHWIQNKEGWQSGANLNDFIGGPHVLPSGQQVNLTPLDKYIMSPGENEAVATEARRLLSSSERRNRLPEEDFPIDYINMYDFYR